MVLWALVAVLPAAAFGEVKYAPLQGQEDGLLTVSPDRWEADVEPGKTTELEVTLINRTGADGVIKLSPTDTAPGGKSEAVIEAVPEFEFGAGSWVKPEVTSLPLKNMQEARLIVRITPPLEAPVGSNFGGLLVELKSGADNTAKVEGDAAAAVELNVRALIQLYPRVPGEIVHGLRITKANIADRVIFTGNRYVVFEFDLENTGNVNEPTTGEVVVKSMFGNTVANIDVRETLVLRGSARRTRVLWTKPPKFGRFTAELRVKAQESDPKEAFPPVTILPPWWWFALFAAVVILPSVYAVYRRRQDWRKYLDEDWDEEAEGDWTDADDVEHA